MDRLIQILSVFLLLTLVSSANAQTPATCGIVDIDGPSEVEPGAPLVFKAKTTSLIQATKPEFKWKVSAGTITAGEGTAEITVDTVGLSGLIVIATVELSGIPLGCKASASKTTQVNVAPLACGRPFDEYGNIKFEDEKARLDNFAIQLTSEPLTKGHILAAAGRETFEKEAAERLERVKSYLVEVRRIDPNRIVTVDCGFYEDLTVKLYMVPVGASIPACSGVAEVPISQVKFTKRRPKPSKKLR